MITVSEADELRSRIRNWREVGETIALVPTMGALHEGHLALGRRAAEIADVVVVSIFVNPTQFGPREDFDSYPRTFDRDELLEREGCDLLFVPAVETMYAVDDCTRIEMEGPARGLEGAIRPGHFSGVATVVTKLLNLVRPHFAVFGQKDAQQLAVVRRLVQDLMLDINIIGHPTVREDDGLALSSRNAYLSMAERQAARGLYRALRAARKRIQAGERTSEVLRQTMRGSVASEPLIDLEYAEIVDPSSFEPIEEIEGLAVLVIAASIGRTRLIDNIRIDPDRAV
ncbi:MAG: pantoate--beta-alanine ligase [Acidobacteriota bacterium]